MIHPPQVRPEEPIAVTPHDGIYGGESQQWLSYPTNPHVRVDERGRETGRCRMAQAPAPVLDSTDASSRPKVVGGDQECRTTRLENPSALPGAALRSAAADQAPVAPLCDPACPGEMAVMDLPCAVRL